jgi:hypothetical protein
VPEIVVLYIDGVIFADHNVIVAMGLDAEGKITSSVLKSGPQKTLGSARTF